MARDGKDEDKPSQKTPAASSRPSTPSKKDGDKPSSSSKNPYPTTFTTTTAFDTKSLNAPTSLYPPPSTNEYAPRPQRKLPPGAPPPAFTLQSLLPLPVLGISGRPTRPPRPPNENDERCIIYCTQTASRRANGAQPICKTFCWRKLYPDDYVQVDPNAPPSNDATDQKQETDGFIQKPGIFGFDGRYVYFGRSRFRAKDRMESMSMTGLPQDNTVEEILSKSSPGPQDEAYIEFLRRYHYSTQIAVGPLPYEVWDGVKERVSKVFAPMQRLTGAYIKSFESGGAQERFAGKAWDKAVNGETWEVAKKVGGKLWENFIGGGKGDGPAQNS